MASRLDIAGLRADTPGADHRLHLDNAGASLMPRPVLEAVTGHLGREALIGGYAAAAEADERLADVYGGVARLINAAADEIALKESATAAWQMAFYALAGGFRPGDRILTARAEYAANYVAFLQVARRTGAVVEVIPDDAQGVLDPEALERMLDERVRLIAITWIPTNGGLVNPAAAVGRVARRHATPYLLDACQAVGQLPVDVEALGCDMLSATGRKFLRGPRGTGFLYVRRDLLCRLEPPMIDHFAAPWVTPDSYRLRDDARRFESWESDHAARLGLGAAVDYALALGLDAIEARCRTWPASYAMACGRFPASRCTTWDRIPPPSSASRWPAAKPTRSRRAVPPPASPSASPGRRARCSMPPHAACRTSSALRPTTSTTRPRSTAPSRRSGRRHARAFSR
jgi:cysteine desulfurase/selenocysteine lyase